MFFDTNKVSKRLTYHTTHNPFSTFLPVTTKQTCNEIFHKSRQPVVGSNSQCRPQYGDLEISVERNDTRALQTQFNYKSVGEREEDLQF